MAKNTVRVNVIGDASSLKRSMGEADRATETTGKKMSTFAKIAVTALAVKALGAVKEFVGDSKRAFVDLTESLNALEVVYGKNAEGIKQLGREAATGLGLSNAEFNSFAVSISNFAKEIAGDNGDVVGTVKDMTGRISDFASVMNIEVSEAAEKFQSGLAGQSRPLREFGIDVSDARVKIFALANGIGDASGELTEGEKVQARYGAIMEQTDQVAGDFANTSDELANATRIANAQMENSKAIIGRALKGAYEAALPLQVSLAKAAADLAIGFMELTGQVTELEAETLRLNQATDGSVESLKEMTDALGLVQGKSGFLWLEDTKVAKDFGDVLKSVNRQLIAQPDLLDLTEKSAAELRFEAQELGRQYNWTQDQTEEFIDMLLFQQEVQSDTGSGDAWLEGLLNQGKAVEELEEKTEEATTALEDFASEVRSQVDPLFAYREATRKVGEAQVAANEARDEFGEGTPQHIEALLDVAEAGYDLEAAMIRVAEQSNLTRSQFETQLKQMGIFTDTEIQSILDDFQSINAFRFSDKSIRINTTGSGSLIGVDFARAHGGPVKAGDTVLVGEEGPEIFQPNQSGNIIPNGSNGGGTIGGGPVVNVFISGTVVTENELVEAVYEGLLKRQKRNGGLGLAG